MKLSNRQRLQRRGTTLVEMALVSAMCLILMFAIFEYGRYVMVWQVMENAARTGARTAAVMSTSYISTTTATTNVNTAVTNALAGQPLQNQVISIYQADTNGNNIGAWTSTPFAGNIVVQIDGDLQLLFPTSFNTKFGSWTSLPNNGAAPNSIHITVKCMMRGEAN